MDRRLEVDDARLPDARLSFLVLLDDVQVRHDGATGVAQHGPDLAALAPLASGQHLDQIVALDAR